MTASPPSLRCVLMGEESLLIRCGSHLLERGHSITGVIADNPQIHEWAAEHDLKQWSPTSDYAEALSDHAFDYFFSVANLRIVPETVLALPERGAVNFHDGPLPEHAGRNVPAWSIIQQHDVHGVTWHEMTAAADEGDILMQQRFPIAADETTFTLNTKCYEAGLSSFKDLIAAIETDAVSPTTQDLSTQTYYPAQKRPAQAGLLDWSAPAAALDALVRGLDYNVTPNPLGTPKLAVDQSVYAVGALTVLPTDATHAPGTIVEVTADQIVVATATQNVALTALHTLAGRDVDLSALQNEHALSAGDRLPLLSDETATQIEAVQSTVVPHESYWRKQLRHPSQLEMPYVDPPADTVEEQRSAQSAPGPVLDADTAPNVNSAVALSGFLARLTQSDAVTLDLRHPDLPQAPEPASSLYADRVPWSVSLSLDAPGEEALQQIASTLATTRSRQTYATDLRARTPALRNRPDSLSDVEVVLLDENDEEHSLQEGHALSLHIHPDGTLTWVYDANRISDAEVDRLQSQFTQFVAGVTDAPEQSFCTLPILEESERHTLLHTWNDTERAYDHTPIPDQFAAQVERTPDAPALSFGQTSWSYSELDARATRIAHRLVELGVEPSDRVGVCVDRSLDMVASLLGIWKAGAAYVPLDPEYPSDRIAFMVSDADLSCVVTQSHVTHLLSQADCPLLTLNDNSTLDTLPTDPVDRTHAPDDLAYVIYTSGSTGTPKGVMVTHRNVANFFAGMDDRIPRRSDAQDVWLAVTSISFDISVLELFWTLTRGFKVVLQTGDRTRLTSPTPSQSSAPSTLDHPVSFSLFYFSSDEKLDGPTGGGASDKYRLLLEGAEFGDRNGFEAVWTPERHFHDFGGLYPNPSVISAALAARTSSIDIRAGSCVSPLHHSVRIAEDWAVVDNLSNGRVGISFAAGWQPDDFVLQPQNFADRKALMFKQIEEVRALWRGEERTYEGPNGPVSLRTLPRPVQSELPVWVTAAGNPETFAEAGTGGYHLLTHLLGQSVEDLKNKIAAYRAAWDAAGHSGRGTVTLMLHTFVGDDPGSVRDTVREPLKNYLRSSVELIKKAAWAFPTFKQKTTTAAGDFSLDGLSEDEMDAVLEQAFERYYATSGLFGTPEQCLERVTEVSAAGVDEIACLLDFGINAQTVLDHLPALASVKERAADLTREVPAHTGDGQPASSADDSIAAQIKRHDVTHLQCTPSQARMLVADDETRSALGALDHLLIGGEAFPSSLARELTSLADGTVHNMYGPTETTIWSSTATVAPDTDTVSLGTPIANTSLYVLDDHRQPVPVGVPGELWIGGDGVTNGYLHREALTAERFAENPFHEGRMYRTGDLVRYAADGTLTFLGRTDFQVKIRGHRIELGEIEAALERQSGVKGAVAHVHETDDGDQRLVAYIQPVDPASPPDPDALRSALTSVLPQIMVPSLYVMLDAFPLTPNGKVNRKALPDPTPTRSLPTPIEEAASGSTEAVVAEIWTDALDLDQVSVTDNFFDLGGHSLLAVQIVRRLSERLNREVPIVDLFQYPTIRSLAAHLDADATVSDGATRGASRAERRRQAFQRR